MLLVRLKRVLEVGSSDKGEPQSEIFAVWDVSHVSDNCQYFHDGEAPGNTADRGVGEVIWLEGTADVSFVPESQGLTSIGVFYRTFLPSVLQPELTDWT
jgi:hypothetical protein